MSSPYAILGLEPNADPRAAKAAFHAVAKSCHPDVNSDPQARQRFEEAREAYRVITLGAASADIGRVGSPRAGRMTEIDLEVSVWIAARGGSVKGSCPLGLGACAQSAIALLVLVRSTPLPSLVPSPPGVGQLCPMCAGQCWQP